MRQTRAVPRPRRKSEPAGLPHSRGSGRTRCSRSVERRPWRFPATELERGRDHDASGAWSDAYAALAAADQSDPLGVADLELLATSAYMLGREDDYAQLLERAHQMHMSVGDLSGATRCAFWLGLSLLLRGEVARANGWLGRAERLLERERDDCVERGYLLIPTLLGHVMRGDDEAAHDSAAEAAAIGERFGDADLVALAVQEEGHALVRQGHAEEGLRLIDEATLAGHDGRALADRHRPDLLQHDRLLPKRV